jgi:hypothetical protein
MKRTEIEGHVSGFYASIMNLILHHRQKRDALNQVPQFVAAVERERARMDQKFAAMLNDKSFADFGHEIHIAQHAVHQLADGEIARATQSNTVEFDNLASAIRSTGHGLANAVSRLENRGNK